MNKRAEKFLAFLEEKNLNKDFIHQEINDQYNTVVFGSSFMLEDNKVEVLVNVDDTVYTSVRARIMTLSEDADELEAAKMVNSLNLECMPIKFYIMQDGSLVADRCIMSQNEKDFNPEMIYVSLDVVQQYVKNRWEDIKTFKKVEIRTVL